MREFLGIYAYLRKVKCKKGNILKSMALLPNWFLSNAHIQSKVNLFKLDATKRFDILGAFYANLKCALAFSIDRFSKTTTYVFYVYR